MYLKLRLQPKFTYINQHQPDSPFNPTPTLIPDATSSRFFCELLNQNPLSAEPRFERTNETNGIETRGPQIYISLLQPFKNHPLVPPTVYKLASQAKNLKKELLQRPAERAFLNLARVTRMLSSMTVSFGGGFVSSVDEEDATASVCIGSTSSAGTDWLADSDAAAVAF